MGRYLKYTKRGAMFAIDARIAILIVAILGLLVYPSVSGIIAKSKAEAINISAKAVTSAIENYIADTGSIPSTINNLFTTVPTKASQANKWKGPYLKGSSTAKFIPTLVWTLENSNCTSTSSTSRYCTYRVSYDFCGFSKAVKETLVKYYTKAESWTSYNTSTKCIKINYGYAENSGVKGYVSFKVKEKP